MQKHFNKLNIKHLLFVHNTKIVLISDNIKSINSLNYNKNIHKVILFHDNFLNKFNNDNDIINYVKNKNLI
jgi:hypothetical protein